mmetsp:Transcript_13542/g.50389  ORF Transcript_13542/g.50389 Transcript_13542/m.50389 type:complete len:233 (+) Transcript_13542:1508-2206(+)
MPRRASPPTRGRRWLGYSARTTWSRKRLSRGGSRQRGDGSPLCLAATTTTTISSWGREAPLCFRKLLPCDQQKKTSGSRKERSAASWRKRSPVDERKSSRGRASVALRCSAQIKTIFSGIPLVRISQVSHRRRSPRQLKRDWKEKTRRQLLHLGWIPGPSRAWSSLQQRVAKRFLKIPARNKEAHLSNKHPRTPPSKLRAQVRTRPVTRQPTSCPCQPCIQRSPPRRWSLCG